MAKDGLRSLVKGKSPESLSDEELLGLEAIVMPRYRPVIDIINKDYASPSNPWQSLGRGKVKKRLKAAIHSIGRVEVPNHSRYPFAGTGFVVGDGLMMTNRHVAEIFASGVGVTSLHFRPGQTAAIDFVKEIIPSDPVLLNVTDVVAVHPHWDMAILKVSGLGDEHQKLVLDVTDPRDLIRAEKPVVVIGYPAQDVRNDVALQNQIFRGVFDVKRFQPGMLRERETVRDSFGNRVNTITHDCSTLGGNSGSPVIDTSTGNVVALHFAGKYMRANFAVPIHELARDPRLSNLGLDFNGSVPPTNDWEKKWKAAERRETLFSNSQSSSDTLAPIQKPQGDNSEMGNKKTMTWTIPLQVSVTVGDAVAGSAVVDSASEVDLTKDSGQEVSLRVPKIYDGLEEREGYQADFLDLEDDEVIELPKLKLAGRSVAAKLDDDTFELKYHKFSVYMHKERRLAIMTASNVDYRRESQEIDGRKPNRRELTEIPEGFGEQWVTDPRIPQKHQLPDVFFTKDRASFDKGHLVRRNDVCWGDSFEDIQKANGDTYHTTNCSPQTGDFNRSNRGEDNWGDLENFIQKQTKAEKAIVFAGPIFRDDDPVFVGRDKHGRVEIPIPQSYWKIVVVKGDDGPEAYGFVLDQDLSDVDMRELTVPGNWKDKQVAISMLEDALEQEEQDRLDLEG